MVVTVTDQNGKSLVLFNSKSGVGAAGSCWNGDNGCNSSFNKYGGCTENCITNVTDFWKDLKGTMEEGMVLVSSVWSGYTPHGTQTNEWYRWDDSTISPQTAFCKSPTVTDQDKITIKNVKVTADSATPLSEWTSR